MRFVKKSTFKVLLICAGVFYSCVSSFPTELQSEINALPKELDFNIDVKPILADKCFACHGPDKAKQKAGLRLDIAENAYAELPENPGKVAIDPGDLGDSEVFRRIMTSDPEEIMPSKESHLTLSLKEKAILAKWINDGAEYKPHWAFQKPKKTSIPSVQDKTWIKNEIDHFVLSKLENEQIKPQNEANKELLLRRVFLDLTGLPPSIADIAAFKADKSLNAYEKVVDRLLASKHYGEKITTDWMDLARFADSHGYTVDRLRDMSPYRDWVIGAFNKNMPYDTFVKWQLAGDLYKSPSQEQLIASAFNRLHQQNMEGGIVEEEFRVEYVSDRTNTLATGFLGLSMECAKCHDHKYDPITQKNYYEMFSFFNNVNEAGQISWDDAMPVPTLQLPSHKQKQIVQFLNTKLGNLEKNIPNDEQGFERWMRSKKSLDLEDGKIASFSFENNLSNTKNKKNKAILGREVGTNNDKPTFVAGVKGKGLLCEGDVWLDTKEIGAFHRYEPFTIGIWVNVPAALHNGVIFHRGLMHLTYGFRGYHLQIKNDKLDFTMARTAPDNAITIHSQGIVPKNKWVHLTVSYDGSSKAKGTKIYINGSLVKSDVIVDNLSKDIAFFGNQQPALQIGAWGRGPGFTKGQIDEVSVYKRELSLLEISALANQNVISIWQKNTFSPKEKLDLKEYYLKTTSETYQKWQQEVLELRKAKNDSSEAIKEIMVMKEMAKPRQAYVLNRGVYDSHGEKVYPNTPESLLRFDPKLPKNRMGLAEWLMHKDHPLTARVAVNRYWQMMFGTGIVRTTNDFGNQGELPSHKDLLDYLAVDFIENKWDVKHLIKKMAMSATYRQSSKTSPDLLARDPENRLLARGPSSRLSAEMMRDNALFACGLLNRSIGGPSIKPYQPEGLWAINGANYVQDSSSEIYKRSLYMVVKRSVPHPSLSTFDAPTRSACLVRRQNTSTPLQALLLMNDPIYIEACKVLASQVLAEGNTSAAIERAFLKITARQPSKKELDLLMQMQGETYKRMSSKPNKSEAWVNTGLFKIDKTADKKWIATNTILINTILNSDACITKR